MKFMHANESAIQKTNEATVAIFKLRKILAKQRLIKKVLGKYILSQVSV